MDGEALVAWVVAVILAVVLLGVIWNLNTPSYEPQSASDSITASNTSYVSLSNPDLSSNASCNCTPYTTNIKAGTVLVNNDSCNGQSVICSYNYYATSYQDNSVTRTIMPIITVLFAVMILSSIAWFAFKR